MAHPSLPKENASHHFLAFLRRQISDQHIRPRISRRRSALNCIRLVNRHKQSNVNHRRVGTGLIISMIDSGSASRNLRDMDAVENRL